MALRLGWAQNRVRQGPGVQTGRTPLGLCEAQRGCPCAPARGPPRTSRPADRPLLLSSGRVSGVSCSQPRWLFTAKFKAVVVKFPRRGGV